MTGKHRLRPDRQVWTMDGRPTHRPYNPADNPGRRIWTTLGLTVTALGAVITVAASGTTVPDAQAQELDKPMARIEPIPAAPLFTGTTPRNADEQHDIAPAGVNEKFLSAVSAAGISTTGREDELLTIAKRGAASHTTDDDLEQSVRALFSLDEKQGEKFVHQVRLAWPGPHDEDTDGSGR